MKKIGIFNMRVLVTGAKGFTGRYVYQKLINDNHEVIELKSDLLDAVALNKEVQSIQPTAVMHLAAVAFVAHDKANDFYQTNLIGTRNLLESLDRHVSNVKSILLVSSAGVYGNKVPGKLSESVLPQPANDYAVSKLAMENMATLWKNRLPLFIVRPFNYTGVGQPQHFVIPKIISHFRDKVSAIQLGNIDVQREFNDVRMVAEIYTKLLAAAPVGKVLNICTSRGHVLRQVIKQCEELTGHQLDVQVNSQFKRNDDLKSLVGDNSRLIDTIGQFKVYDLVDTLQWMLSSE